MTSAGGHHAHGAAASLVRALKPRRAQGAFRGRSGAEIAGTAW
ncbi:hypothetical protein AAFG13_33840 [Bradyrhizobium sp. B124]